MLRFLLGACLLAPVLCNEPTATYSTFKYNNYCEAEDGLFDNFYVDVPVDKVKNLESLVKYCDDFVTILNNIIGFSVSLRTSSTVSYECILHSTNRQTTMESFSCLLDSSSKASIFKVIGIQPCNGQKILQVVEQYLKRAFLHRRK